MIADVVVKLRKQITELERLYDKLLQYVAENILKDIKKKHDGIVKAEVVYLDVGLFIFVEVEDDSVVERVLSESEDIRKLHKEGIIIFEKVR